MISTEQAAMGFEPMNNGFANRRLGNVSTCNNNNLQKDQPDAYTPAYKRNPKTQANSLQNLPADLAGIVEAWSTLPEHVRQAIVTLVASVTVTAREGDEVV